MKRRGREGEEPNQLHLERVVGGLVGGAVLHQHVPARALVVKPVLVKGAVMAVADDVADVGVGR